MQRVREGGSPLQISFITPCRRWADQVVQMASLTRGDHEYENISIYNEIQEASTIFAHPDPEYDEIHSVVPKGGVRPER